jgi:hypothetical protein
VVEQPFGSLQHRMIRAWGVYEANVETTDKIPEKHDQSHNKKYFFKKDLVVIKKEKSIRNISINKQS